MHRYLIEDIKVCTPFKLQKMIFYCLFGASFMSIACSEVKILKMKKECYFHGYGGMYCSMENLENQTFASKNHILGLE